MKSQDSYFATKLKNIHVSNFKFTLTYESSKNFFVATIEMERTTSSNRFLTTYVLGIYETFIIQFEEISRENKIKLCNAIIWQRSILPICTLYNVRVKVIVG